MERSGFFPPKNKNCFKQKQKKKKIKNQKVKKFDLNFDTVWMFEWTLNWIDLNFIYFHILIHSKWVACLKKIGNNWRGDKFSKNWIPNFEIEEAINSFCSSSLKIFKLNWFHNVTLDLFCFVIGMEREIESKYESHPWRWVNLFLFCLISMMQSKNFFFFFLLYFF